MIGASQFWSVLSSSYEFRNAGPWSRQGKGVAKAVGGLRGKAPVPELVALALRSPAVAKPKLAAKGNAAPKGEAVIPAGKAKGLAKAKALGDNAVAPVLPVACGLLGGGPFCHHLWGLQMFYLICLCRSLRSLHQSPMSHHLLREGIPPRLALPAFLEGLHPVGFPLAFGGRFAPLEEVQVLNPWLLCPIPLLIVLETLLDGLMGPAGLDGLHRLSANPGDFVEFFWCTITAGCPQPQVLCE